MGMCLCFFRAVVWDLSIGSDGEVAAVQDTDVHSLLELGGEALS